MSDDREQKIRESAYGLYESRGRQAGHELEDWYRAEAEMRSLFYFPSASSALRQGEILSNVAQLLPGSSSYLQEAEPEVTVQTHPLVVLLSQDCDLFQDFQARQKIESPAMASSDKLLPSLLLCQATEAEKLMSTIMGKDIRKRIYQNKDERYQYLRAVEPEQDALGKGLQSMILDFKRYFTLSTGDLYYQVRANAQRRAILSPSYLEHLTARFFNFLARVALPEDHY